MARIFCMILLLVAAIAMADSNSKREQDNRSSGFGENIFDDKVFDLNSAEADQPKTQKAPSGKLRSVDYDQPRFNRKQRSEWLATCEAMRRDPEKYKECFLREKKKSAQKLKMGFDAVEKRQAKPLRDLATPGTGPGMGPKY